MANSPTKAGRLTVEELKGLNEREQHANNDLGYFDVLRGCIPVTKNTLTRANGCKLALNFGEPVLSICQTNDSRQNIIIQLNSSIRIISEAQLFNYISVAPNLTPVSGSEEETMSRAIIVHKVAAGSNGGTYTTTNTWQQAPLSAILSQLNPDGSAASFVSLASNQFTLAAGVYRFNGWSIMSSTTTGRRVTARLYNVTAAAAAWNGAANEDGDAKLTSAGDNTRVVIGGDLTLAAPTIFEMQSLMNIAQTNTGFGTPQFTASAPIFTSAGELYRWIEILKTA